MEDTLAAIGGRTIHTYHTEGAGGGHAPDIIRAEMCIRDRSTYVSAFTAAMKIKQFTMCPFDAIATSASVFCSQNLGAGQSDRIKNCLLYTSQTGQ